MNQSNLLQKLRHQVVNDDLGTVCCRPREQATEYFSLAKKVVDTPAREDKLFTLLLSLVGGENRDHPYEVWACLFDGLDDLLAGRPLSGRVQAVALEQCVRSAGRSDSTGLHEALHALLSNTEVWGESMLDPAEYLPRILQPISSNLEIQPASHMDLDKITSCLREVQSQLQKRAHGEGNLVAVTLAGSLLQDTPVGETSSRDTLGQAFQNAMDPQWLRCRMAAMLLEHVDQPAQCAQHVAILFRDACQALSDSPKELPDLLGKARQFFSDLHQDEIYRDFYRFALHTLSIHLANRPTPGDLKERLLDVHPQQAEASPLADLLWGVGHTGARPDLVQGIDQPAWKDVFFALLGEEDAANRIDLVRRWLYERMTFLFTHHPDRVSAFLRDTVQPAYVLSKSTNPDYMAWLAGSTPQTPPVSES